MCESASFRSLDTRRAAGDARLRLLHAWVAEDIRRMTMGFSPIAHLRWRDEVITRLPSFRPIKIRIPRIIVNHLYNCGLCSEDLLMHRTAWLLTKGEVIEEVRMPGCELSTARIIVPSASPRNIVLVLNVC